MLSRRAFLQSLTIASGGLAVGAAFRDLQPDGYTGRAVVEEVSIKHPNIPAAFDGYRIGFLTDLHVSMWVPLEWIRHALDTLAQKHVDLLILGGDYIFVTDNPIWTLSGHVRNDTYQGLKSSEIAAKAFADVAHLVAGYTFKDGTFGVLGNHEHWNNSGLFFAAIKDHPTFRCLVNEEISVTRGDYSLDILGVDDFLTGTPLQPPSRKSRLGKHMRILVSHNPDYISALLQQGAPDFDLALCGHTHGGQVRLPGLQGVVVPIQDLRFLSGLSQIGDAYSYTSRGLGVVGIPFRFNCPAEITIIELRST